MRTSLPVERPRLPALKNIATRLRIESVRATTEAGSGHPTTCCSAADIMAALFFAEMRYDPRTRSIPTPIASCCRRGTPRRCCTPRGRRPASSRATTCSTLRELDSDLEGHPTPRLPFVDVATGSLGQGLCAGVGIALNARRIGSDYRTYVLLGDGETAEGSVWEAAAMAEFHQLDSLCGITDVNGLGQSRADAVEHDMEAHRRALGRLRLARDRHRRPRHGRDPRRARRGAAHDRGQPTMILARTIKGKGVSFIEGKPSWHGKALKKGDEMERAIAELEAQLVPEPAGMPLEIPSRPPAGRRVEPPASVRGARLQARRRWSRRAKPTAPRSPGSAPPTRASSRSTPT